MNIGIHENIPFDEYQSWDAINATALKKGAKSFKHMNAVMTGELKYDSSSMALGRLAHIAVLEQERLGNDVIPYDGGIRRGKAWEAFKNEHSDCKIVKPSEMGTAELVQMAVFNDPEAMEMISNSLHEVSFLWETERYGRAKARVDFLGSSFWGDFKTTSKLGLRSFSSQFFGELGYHIQFGWIAEGLEVLGKRKEHGLQPWVIAAESDIPLDVVCYEVQGDVINYGQRKAVALAAGYRACQAVNSFPGISGGMPIALNLPEWMKENVEINIGGSIMEA